MKYILTLMYNLESECGYEKYGTAVLYNGRTGKDETIFIIGPTYYQRLKQMVQDKIEYEEGDYIVI